MTDSIERIIRDLEADAATLETTDVGKWEDNPADIARINRAYADRLRALIGKTA